MLGVGNVQKSSLAVCRMLLGQLLSAGNHKEYIITAFQVINFRYQCSHCSICPIALEYLFYGMSIIYVFQSTNFRTNLFLCPLSVSHDQYPQSVLINQRNWLCYYLYSLGYVFSQNKYSSALLFANILIFPTFCGNS